MPVALYALIAALLPTFAYAQERSAADLPSPTAHPIVLVLFAVIFFGGIAWFGWVIWRNEQKRKAVLGE